MSKYRVIPRWSGFYGMYIYRLEKWLGDEWVLCNWSGVREHFKRYES